MNLSGVKLYDENIKFEGTIAGLSPDIELRSDVARHQSIIQNAQRRFAWQIFDPLRDSIGLVLNLSDYLRDLPQHYIKYGAGRRLGILFYSYATLLAMAPPERTTPLSDDEQRSTSRDLNVIYINIRGVLDCLSWALIHLNDNRESKNIPASQVNIFLPKFRMQCDLPNYLSDRIQEFDAWEREFKKRRDPSAHQIPLSVPRSIMKKSEASEAVRLLQNIDRRIRSFDLGGAERELAALEKLGTFNAFFGHEPMEPLMPIYPTVPEDIRSMLVLVDNIASYIKQISKFLEE